MNDRADDNPLAGVDRHRDPGQHSSVAVGPNQVAPAEDGGHDAREAATALRLGERASATPECEPVYLGLPMRRSQR